MLDLPSLPDDVTEVSSALQRGLDRILGDAFASLFLYGAAAFPRPEHWRIDFDFHVLLHRPLHDDDRAAIRALYAELAESSELGGDLDGFYVLLADAARPEPPRHHLKLSMRDETWALIRAHVHAGRYFVTSGLDPREVVPTPTWTELGDSLRAELAFVEAHPEAAAYGILDSARILYSFQTRDVVVSKYAAGQWALGALPEEWHASIRAATRWYGRTETADDPHTLEATWASFVAYVNHQLPT